MANKLPTVTSQIAPDLRRFLERLREYFDGQNGVVTKADLRASGAFSTSGSGGVVFTGSETTYCSSPPTPLNLRVVGAMTSIILEWDGVVFDECHAYTEIWRSDVNDIGQAVLLGTSAGEIYSDSVGGEASFYYWVRNVNINDDTGAFNATGGTSGNTSPDITYLMSMLSTYYGSTSEAPFFQLDAPLSINGVLIPAGTYIDTAFIHDASITNAKIGDAAIDTAKVSSLSAAKITFGSMHGDRITANTLSADRITANTFIAKLASITAAYIGTANIKNGAVTNLKIGNIIESDDFDGAYYPDAPTNLGTKGWSINKNGEAILHNAYVRGTIYADAGVFSGTLSGATGTFSGDLTAGHISGSTITGSTISGGIIEGAVIVSGLQLRATQAGAPYYTRYAAYQYVNNGTMAFYWRGSKDSADGRWRGYLNTPNVMPYNASPSGTAYIDRFYYPTVSLSIYGRLTATARGCEGNHFLYLERADTGAIIAQIISHRTNLCSVSQNGVTFSYSTTSGITLSGTYTFTYSGPKIPMRLHWYVRTWRGNFSTSSGTMQVSTYNHRITG